MKLFDFQQFNVDKLKLVPNVLIGDEMGLGKTYQGIALDVERRCQFSTRGSGKTLIVTPKTTIVSPWVQKFKELTDLSVVEVDPKNRQKSWKKFIESDADVFIVHWDVLRLMPELGKVKWLHVIADECHRAQNRAAKQTRALKQIKTQFKTGLSGTPVTNQTDKFWSILNWLYPKEYGSYWKFFARYVDWEMEYANGTGYKKPKGPKNVEELLAKIESFYARHLKKERCCDLHPNGVLPELPEKYYTTIEVDLDPKQRRAFDQMKADMVAWVGEQDQERPLVAPVVVAQLTRLQQFAVAYANIAEDGHAKLSDPSTKIDALMQIIEDNPDEQLVVFSQFSQLIALVNQRLKDKSVKYVSITGDVPHKLRSSAIDKFQDRKAQIFTGTIAAGGVGITLTSASTVIFLDRSWSPALNSQAEDRCHRIGQENAVQIVDIMAKDTVDLGRKQQIDQKWEWLRELLGDKQK